MLTGGARRFPSLLGLPQTFRGSSVGRPSPALPKVLSDSKHDVRVRVGGGTRQPARRDSIDLHGPNGGVIARYAERPTARPAGHIAGRGVPCTAQVLEQVGNRINTNSAVAKCKDFDWFRNPQLQLCHRGRLTHATRARSFRQSWTPRRTTQSNNTDSTTCGVPR
jgi:hypothetical protein